MQAELKEDRRVNWPVKPKPWVVATDGSADHVAGLGAHAWVARDGQKGSSCEAGVTSTMAEWAAIEAALHAAPDGRPIIIYSDFRTAVKVISRVIEGRWVDERYPGLDPAVAATIQRLRELLANKDVTIIWIRSHTGHRNSPALLNKSADHLARATLRRTRYYSSEHYVI